MNKKLEDQIHSLIKTLDDAEIKAFQKPQKGNPAYLDLFGIFLKYKPNNKKYSSIDFEAEVSKLAGEYNDLKENLLKKLIEFVRKIDEQKRTDYYEIKNNIEAVNALINRQQFDLANDLILKNFKKLQKLKADGISYHLFLQYLNQVLEIQRHRYDKSTKTLKTDFEDKPALEWLNRLTQFAANNITTATEKVSDDFRSNLFFNLLIDYLALKEEFRSASGLMDAGGYSLDLFSFTNKGQNPDDQTLASFRVLTDLMKLQLAVRLNDTFQISYLLNSIRNNSITFREKNYPLFAFLLMQVSDFRHNIGLDTKQFELLDRKLDEITRKDLRVFTDREIEGIGLRLEINKGLILLFSEEYEGAYTQFSKIPLLENMEQEHKFYIKLYEAISYGVLPPDIFEVKTYEKQLNSLERSKYKGSNYKKAFLKFLLENTNRKNLLNSGKEFLETHTPLSTYDKVCHQWLLQIQQKI